MPELDDRLATQDESVDVENTPADGGGNSGAGSDNGGSGEEEYFLTVDDRTRYRTPDDAITAFKNAGSRIASLSGWEKLAQEYGIPDANSAKELFNELIDHRRKAQEAQNAPKETPKQNAETHSVDEANLTKDEKEVLTWLKKMAPQLGFVPQTELQRLQKEMEEFKSQFTTSRETEFVERRESLISDGRAKLNGWLSTDQINGDESIDYEGQPMTVSMAIENEIRDYINGSDARIKEFYTGGMTTENLIKRGYDRALKQLGLSPSAKTADTLNLARNKQNAMARNPKRLPQHGLPPKKGEANDGVKKDAAGRKDFIGSVHDKAWEVFQSRNGSGKE